MSTPTPSHLWACLRMSAAPQRPDQPRLAQLPLFATPLSGRGTVSSRYSRTALIALGRARLDSMSALGLSLRQLQSWVAAVRGYSDRPRHH